jgi:hypothetical protein
MYSVSEIYANKIMSNDRKFALRLTFGSSTVLTGTTIQNITLDEIINSTDALTMGCACSNKITVNLINPPTGIAYDGADFTAEVGLLLNDRPVTYEWIPLGKFYGAEAETNNDFKNLKLTAYDGFCKMTGKYNATVGSETTLQVVYDDLRSQLYTKCGVVLKERALPEYTISNFPYLDITYAQAIGYVAGCLGENARFDRKGELEFVWYADNGIVIDRSQQYMNGFKRTTDKVLTVTSVSTGTQENPIVRGEGANGVNVNFENPYITDALAGDIYSRINGFEYTPCQVKWRGNPAIQVGDMLKAYDKDNNPHTVLVMSQSLKIGGGCNATIDCKGKGETTSNFSNNFESTSKKIDRMYKGLEKAILEATNKITGNSGGYVEIIDTNDDGKPDEIVVMDLEDIHLATKVWRWNKEGLGYAHREAGNAYELGSFEFAITADGKINADFIATGTLTLGGTINDNGGLKLYDGSNALLCTLNKDGITIYSSYDEETGEQKGNYVVLNAEGLVGYNKHGERIYWAEEDIFHMQNAQVENEIQIAGMIKIVPVNVPDGPKGIGFVALS